MNTRQMRISPRTFCACCGLSLVLMGCTVPLYWFEPGATGPAPGVIVTGWMWVFFFPYMAAFHLGLKPLALPLMLLNPLIYGLMWALTWEMFRLCRRPRGEE